MVPKRNDQSQKSLFFSLEDTLNRNHPLFILANKIDWKKFELAFEPLYCKDNGRPGKPIRLMVGLLILKHLRNLSDESVVEQWSENMYYQYFCGESFIVCGPPCEASELVHFRKRIGESGIELILEESIRVNGEEKNADVVIIDTTVQEKNITFPTDDKLYKKIIKKCQKISEELNLPVRQSYRRILKRLMKMQRFRNHPKNRSKARKADKKVKTIAGRLVRELERNLEPNSVYQKDLELFNRILNQKRSDKDKIYSVHEPEVCCISKGKEHKKYEFGNKVSISKTESGVIVGAKSFRNPYDGHTLEVVLNQVKDLSGLEPKFAIVDRGYRGVKKIGKTEILSPQVPLKGQSRYKTEQLRKLHCKRAGIEAVIGHLKQDHRMQRNFYKGLIGDSINVMLAAAAFNFKRMMNIWKNYFFQFSIFHFLQLSKRFFIFLLKKKSSVLFKG